MGKIKKVIFGTVCLFAGILSLTGSGGDAYGGAVIEEERIQLYHCRDDAGVFYFSGIYWIICGELTVRWGSDCLFTDIFLRIY